MRAVNAPLLGGEAQLGARFGDNRENFLFGVLAHDDLLCR